MDDDAHRLELTGRSRPAFHMRTVVIAADTSRPYLESEWRDSLVVVDSGEVEVETTTGERRRFASGDILFFTGLSIRRLRNPGAEATVLKAVSRRTGVDADGKATASG